MNRNSQLCVFHYTKTSLFSPDRFDKLPLDEENARPGGDEGDSLDDICSKMDSMQINSSSDGSYYSTSNSPPPPQPPRNADDYSSLNVQEKRIEDMRSALLLNRQQQLSKFNNVDINRNEASASTSFRQIENVMSPRTPDRFFASPARRVSMR